jgi:AP-1 complex subunit mu
MPASAIFVLDLKGKVLLWRDYRGDVPLNIAERFMNIIMAKDEQDVRPIFEEDGVTYIYVKYKNLYIMTVTKHNADAAMLLIFLYKLIQVFTAYFQELEEESLKDNFVIIYELLDEMMDFGYPQATDAKILQEFITQEFYKLEQQPRPPPALTTAVSWRSEGIKYRKNEVFLDVIENVNVLVAANGTVLRSEIVGSVQVRSYLSGMPELRLGLNDRVQFESNTQRSLKKGAIEMEDVNFHQCVRLSRFDSDRTISFIPPDKDFELMSYRLNTQIKPLIWVEAIVESHERSRVEYLVKARSQFKARSTANNVGIFIPVPPDADSPKFRANVGTVKYVPERDAILWYIPKFQGAREYLMRAHFGLPSTTSEDLAQTKPPITVKFEIPYFTVSGIQVRYLKIIERSGYQALPWVRYITKSGDYQLRLS